MAGIEDQTLLTRLTRVVEATVDPAAVTATPAFQAAVVEARARGAAARDLLLGAVRAAETDAAENRSVAATFDEAAGDAAVEYAVLKEDRNHELLSLRPREAAALGGAEVARRADFVATTFDAAPSDLLKLGRTALLAKLRSAVKRCQDTPDLVPARKLAPFAAAVVSLGPAHAAVVAEGIDDVAVSARLATARARAHTTLVACRGLIDSLLRFEESPLSVDAFLLRTTTGGGSAAEPAPEPVPAPAPEPVA